MNVIAFAGRNTTSIISDFLRSSGEKIGTLLLVSRDEEVLWVELPEGVAKEVFQVPVKKFRAEAWRALNGPCVIICNGGTTAQQVPVVRYACHWHDNHQDYDFDPNYHELVFVEVTREKIIDLSD